ncbi:serine hydrolase [Hamadaea tsunoensis]|uniref:hypothetical protein n=1 Tax=Hamadaea tsunoensis TaxID=53368 RepID=UPI0004013076|nr:hypothetical protein [Hamadaea tsunoensis]
MARRRKSRSRAPILVAVLSVLLGVGLLGVAVYAKLGSSPLSTLGSPSGPSPSPSPPPPPPPTLKSGPVSQATPPGGFFAWAFYDRRTDEMTGSANSDSGTNSVESMIKAWMAADYLKRHDTLTAAAKTHISGAIRNSNNSDATWLYKQNGGKTGLTRLVATCGLKHMKQSTQGWAYTTMTAQDAARMGACIGDGTAAGPQWTDYLLDEMKHVQGPVTDNKINGLTGGGHWGIIDGLVPEVAEQTSIKNGWTMLYADFLWHVNCLAINPDWVLAVQVRYKYNQTAEKQAPITAANICKSVARQLSFPKASPSPSVNPSA